MFGSLRPLPLPEYRQILLETGLDVDGRLQQLTHRQLPNYEKGYFLYLNFVRDVPGFRNLPMEDQDILIKGEKNMCRLYKANKKAFHFQTCQKVNERTKFILAVKNEYNFCVRYPKVRGLTTGCCLNLTVLTLRWACTYCQMDL